MKYPEELRVAGYPTDTAGEYAGNRALEEAYRNKLTKKTTVANPRKVRQIQQALNNIADRKVALQKKLVEEYPRYMSEQVGESPKNLEKWFGKGSEVGGIKSYERAYSDDALNGYNNPDASRFREDEYDNYGYVDRMPTPEWDKGRVNHFNEGMPNGVPSNYSEEDEEGAMPTAYNTERVYNGLLRKLMAAGKGTNI